MNNDPVFEIRVEKARNAIRHAASKAIADYQLPGVMIELVIESLLSDMRQGRISYLAEQTTLKEGAETSPEAKEGEDGEHTTISG